KVATDDTRLDVAPTETAYIPVDLARSQMQRVVHDMHELKAEHARKLGAVVERFSAIEAATKAHYEAFVVELKRRTLERIQQHKYQYGLLQQTSEEAKKNAMEQIQSLSESIRALQLQHTEQLSMWEQEREASAYEHKTIVAQLRQAYETEQSRLIANAKAEKELADQYVARCSMQLEDCPQLKDPVPTTPSSPRPIEGTLVVHTILPNIVNDAIYQRDLAHMQQELQNAKEQARETQEAFNTLVVEHQVSAVLNEIVSSIAASTTPRQTVQNKIQRLLQTNLEPPKEYDHLVECEMNMEDLKVELDQLKALSAEIHQNKISAKQKIKDWLTEFQTIHQREPTLSDKAQVKDLYVAFKQAEDKYNQIKTQVTSTREKYQDKIAQVEALQNSENMKKFPHHALVAHLRSALDEAHAKLDAITRTPRTPLNHSTRARQNTPASKPTEFEQRPPPQESALIKENSTKSLLLPVSSSTGELKLSNEESIQRQVNGLLEEKQMSEMKLELAPPHKNASSSTTDENDSLDSETMQRQSLQTEPPVTKYLPSEAPKDHIGDSKDADGDNKIIQPQEYVSQDKQKLCAVITEDSIPKEAATQLKLKLIIDPEIEHLRQAIANEHTLASQMKETQLALQEELLSWRWHFQIQEESQSTSEEVEEEELNEVTDNEAFPPVAETKTPIRDAVATCKAAIEAGKIAWNQGDKIKCHSILLEASENTVSAILGAEATQNIQNALTEAETMVPAKAAVVLRKALDAFVTTTAVEAPQTKLMRQTTPSETSSPNANSKVVNEYKQKLKVVESKWKADRVKINQLEQALSKASNSSKISKDDSGGNERVWTKKLADAEKKAQKVLDDAQTQASRQIQALRSELDQATAKTTQLTAQVQELTTTISTLRGQTSQMSQMESEMSKLREEAATASTLSTNLKNLTDQYAHLEAQYKEEQALRKKYYNTIEDMKGKIRVYCRCRPMSSSELERGCNSCVRFFTLEVETSRGPRSFTYDAVFNPSHSQDQVFEDTKHLLQSALDGYNVCIFAYGQTGSGKTFTMTGTESHPGITRRLINLMFALKDSQPNQTVTYEASMLELYNDQLIDLLAQLEPGYKDDKAQKLDIKKNEKGMVVVTNSVLKPCTSAEGTLKLFDAANKKRQVGATKMNAESSRSHSVFTILIENFNKTTKQTSVGKLSLVDLAGSERAGKTGATAERLKEAQAINKSLSALGDVISALSTNEKFIPYRNNKLTQLMQDSLGGNAKTLMFVNISPADYNQEETQTSLSYASRVKLITNQANKNSDSEEVAKLKQIIKQLKAGEDVDLNAAIE
ncbi:hypothetical protein AeRB84_015213, partial [Aphanomyces euteiches]